MNDFFTIRFITENESEIYTQITFLFEDDNYYNIIISDDTEDIFYASNVKSGYWQKFDFGKVFKYNVKLLKFDGVNLDIINNYKFDINNHFFNILLKSNDEKELKIWKYYLWLLQIKLNTKFNIIINDDFSYNDNYDFVEISRESYINYIKKTSYPLNQDFSSLTIISRLFDIIDDNSDIINHPWIKN